MTYFVTDKELEELSKKVVSEIYNNKDIVDLKNNGRPLQGNIAELIKRQITSIYSNINGHKALQNILINAFRYSILIEKNSSLEAEFKKLREASDRRKNMLLVFERKLENDKNNELILNDIKKTKEEILLLDEQISNIVQQNLEPPKIKKNILDIAKKSYQILLRGDKTSEKFYIEICKNLNVKIDPSHFGYDVYNQYNQYNQYNEQNNNYKQIKEEKKDIYIPPPLQHNYGRRRKY